MSTRNIVYLVIASVVLSSISILFAFIPASLLQIYNTTIKPVVFFALALFAYLYIGRDLRPVIKAYQANICSILVVMSFASMILFVSFIFGGGRNVMTPSIMAVLQNFWTFGIPLILGELIRFKIIKSTPENNLAPVVLIVTIVFTLVNLSGFRTFILFQDANFLRFFFESIMPALTISGLLTYMSIRGTVLSVIIVSFVLNLGSTFSPVLPIVQNEVWALIVSILAFCSGVLFYYLTDDKNASQRKRLSRAAKYAPGNPVRTFLGVTFAVLGVAFFLNMFPVYPVVILTGSMTGSHDRGSLVIMRRIHPEHVEHVIEIGDVVHYHMGAVEFVHRVIDVTYVDGDIPAFITQGDANEFPDPMPLLHEDVIGTPVFNIPFLGFPNLVFRSMTGGIF